MSDQSMDSTSDVAAPADSSSSIPLDSGSRGVVDGAFLPGESEALYREAQQLARMGHWSYDPVSDRFLWCSEQTFELLGLDPSQDARPERRRFLTNAHPEDQAVIDSQIAHTILTGEPCVFTHRVLKSGEICYLEVRGVGHRAPDGSINRVSGTVMDVTERYLAQERSRMFESLADVSLDAIVIAERDEQLTIRYANHAAHRLFGCDPECGEMLGKSGRLFWPTEDLPVLGALLSRAPEGWSGDVRQRRSDGTIFDASATVFLMPGSIGRQPRVVAMIRDISERKRMESALQLTQFAVDRSSLGVFLVDPSACLRYVNDAVVDTLGFSREELLRMTVKDIDPDIPREQLPEIFEQLRRDGRHLLETRHRRKDGSTFPVEISSNYLLVEGQEYDCCFARDMTERWQAEQDLLSSRRYLSELIDTLPDALFAIDADGAVTIWNRAIEQMSGVSRESVLGQRGSAYAKAFYGRRRPMLIDLVRPGMQAGDEIQELYDYVQRDGDVVLAQVYLPLVYGGRGAYVWGKAVPFRDDRGQIQGALEIIRDITEQKAAEKALRISEERFRSVVSNAPVLIFEFDESGLFRLIEGRGLETLRARPADMPGSPVAAFFGNEESVCGHISRAIAGESSQFTARVDHRVFETFFNPVKDPRTLAVSVIGVAVDVTERTEREAELQQRTDELTRFTYTVSHDLKSPLVTIRTFLGFLEQDIQTQNAERIAKDVGFIRNAAERMSRLLDELLELSRIGRIANEPTEFSLQEVVQEALDLVAGRIVQRGVEVRVTERRVIIRADRPRLTEVFLNLFDNAVKFIGDRADPRIEINIASVDGQLVFGVSDNGVGIDPRHAHKIFGLFEKLETGTEGTGIGLTLVQRIIEVHGGRIWVESPGSGQGATFHFTLPGARLASD
jgi:PAS domain S-box-containing protein